MIRKQPRWIFGRNQFRSGGGKNTEPDSLMTPSEKLKHRHRCRIHPLQVLNEEDRGLLLGQTMQEQRECVEQAPR